MPLVFGLPTAIPDRQALWSGGRLTGIAALPSIGLPAERDYKGFVLFTIRSVAVLRATRDRTLIE